MPKFNLIIYSSLFCIKIRLIENNVTNKRKIRLIDIIRDIQYMTLYNDALLDELKIALESG